MGSSGHPAFAHGPHRVGPLARQAGPDLPGHSFRPPAMARVGRGASQTMLPQDEENNKNIEYFTFKQLEMVSKAISIPFIYDYQMKLYFSVQRKWQNKSGCFKKGAILHSLPESRWPSWERETGWKDLFQVISPF